MRKLEQVLAAMHSFSTEASQNDSNLMQLPHPALDSHCGHPGPCPKGQEAYREAAEACRHSSRRCRWAGCRTSPPDARSRWCCRCHPGEDGAVCPSCPSPWRCRRKWSCEGRVPPASCPLWSHYWGESWTTGTQKKRSMLLFVQRRIQSPKHLLQCVLVYLEASRAYWSQNWVFTF